MFDIPSKEEIANLDKDLEVHKADLTKIVDDIISQDQDEKKINQLTPEERAKIGEHLEALANHFQHEMIRMSSYLRHEA